MNVWTGQARSQAADDDYLDGNALAGPLSEVFSIDITAALGTCSGCGAEGAIAEARLYVSAPAKILRCPSCGAVLLRLDEREGRLILDLSGFRNVTIHLD
ncbi:DUF6510 family protein [Sinomonas sp. JGH33]|uniref:DUF6510 family protein n=1 Tax=Sinomonas terricola TaxID=3110330 RepID=A0ABU5T8K4_9MICC|nr:DUF6510 family protein [Sinomonas sp. JGH33]MEA5455847.1 DUF6510 family protein [Sinomonas sp. JGH33]